MHHLQYSVSLGLGLNVVILVNLTTLNLNTSTLVLPKVGPIGVQQSQFHCIVALHYVSIYIYLRVLHQYLISREATLLTAASVESIKLLFNFQREAALLTVASVESIKLLFNFQRGCSPNCCLS